MNYTTPAIDPTDPLGTDLALDANGDLILTEQGDVQLVSGVDNIKQMIRVRLQTVPDSYLFGSDLGSDLGQMVDEPLTPQNQKMIEQLAVNTLTDQRIASVNNIKAIGSTDGSMQTYVSVDVDVIGYGSVSSTVPLGGVTGV